jgi:hypothetical protein
LEWKIYFTMAGLDPVTVLSVKQEMPRPDK